MGGAHQQSTESVGTGGEQGQPPARPGFQSSVTTNRRAKMVVRQRLGRLLADRILALAPCLPAPDAALLTALYRDGASFQAVAKVRGVDVRLLRRRVRKLVDRLLSPGFALVATHAASWPAERAAVARAAIIDGLSIRATARQTGIPIHIVRREMLVIEAMIEHAALAAPGRAAAPAPRPSARRIA